VQRRSARTADWKVTVVNRTTTDEIQTLVRHAFEGLSVEVLEDEDPEETTNTLVLTKDDDVIATSDIATLRQTLLLVNSDLYSTGTVSVEEIDPPEVLLELSDTVFELRGYPMSSTEKLVLIVMARYIEQQAFVAGEGTLRSSFQRLSRIDDEYGTKRIYERLSQTDIDVHVYGVPDWEPPSSMDMTVHGGRSEEHRRTWTVIYQSPSEDTDIAMVAYETGTNVWNGFWTFNTPDVWTIEQTVHSLLE
jgi:hypothetical protein